MYKPHTIEQYKVLQYMKEHFQMDQFILSPLSRSSLMLEDMKGEKIAFGFLDGSIHQVSIP